MTDAIYYPKELGDVIDKAVGRCLERINAGEEDSIAFLITMNFDGKLTDQRIAVEFNADYVEPKANCFEGEKANIKIYALAFVALLYWKGKNRKAIFVEVGERENDESMVLALRYKTSDKPKRKLVLQGRLDLVGMRDSRIYGRNTHI